MPDITTITAAIQSLRTASELVAALRTADAAFEKAGLKFQVANLIEALADTRMRLSEIQDLLAAKDQELSALRDALSIKASVVRRGNAYYETDERGEPKGSPFCPRCWEVDHRLLHLVRVPKDGATKTCPECKRLFEARSTSEIRDEPPPPS